MVLVTASRRCSARSARHRNVTDTAGCSIGLVPFQTSRQASDSSHMPLRNTTPFRRGICCQTLTEVDNSGQWSQQAPAAPEDMYHKDDAQAWATPAATASAGIIGQPQIKVRNTAGCLVEKTHDASGSKTRPSKFDHSRPVSWDRSKGAAALAGIDNLLEVQKALAEQLVAVENEKVATVIAVEKVKVAMMKSNGSHIADAIEHFGMFQFAASMVQSGSLTPEEALKLVGMGNESGGKRS